MTCKILGMRVDVTTYGKAIESIFRFIDKGNATYVCVANVHMVMEAFDNSGFLQTVNQSGLVTADGMPLVWGQRLLGAKNSARVYGPLLTLKLCNEAARLGVPVGFYGGTDDVLLSMTDKLKKLLPSLLIVYKFSPPFRSLAQTEEINVIDDIKASGAKILFVGLGCPKQEYWMAAHEKYLPSVLVGVGAAFDFIAGSKPQAPIWMQNTGLEWLFRFLSEPRRLWKRYLYHNPRFVFYFTVQLITSLFKRKDRVID